MASHDIVYDVAVVGGGPIGLSAAYETAKEKHSVIVLEKNNFFNQAGSSNDLARMYRTMYTEDFMADLAHESLDIWTELEREAGEKLRLMTGLLNFGDPHYGDGGPEGTLLEPIKNLDRLKMKYKKLTKSEIETEHPFKNLPDTYMGLFAPDDGVINLPLLLRTLYRLAESKGVRLEQETAVKALELQSDDKSTWHVRANRDGHDITYRAKKIIITSGAYVNHILDPSFGIKLRLDIWEMVASYFSVEKERDKKPHFPCMWFQFQGDINHRSQLFYGFPVLPWGPPDVARIAVDAATRRITDPDERQGNVVDPSDVANTQEFVKERITGVDSTVPVFNSTCLQTNVFDNMFVLDHVPAKYLQGGPEKSVVVFTAGWAMKFVPLLGQALRDLAIDGHSKHALDKFKITRKDPNTHEALIVERGRD